MARRLAVVLGSALTLVGVVGLLTAVPAVQRAVSPRAEPTPLRLRVPGTYYDAFTVDLTPGLYAIWATRPVSGPAGDLCQVTGPDSRPVPVHEPAIALAWTEVATDDTLWSRTSTFTVPTAGTHAFACRLQPESTGQQYAVTAAPDRRLALRLWLESWRGLMVAALPAGLVILGMTRIWRRRQE
ncbi:hypothetical protein ACFOW4_20105 [Micromonospora sp. GCM10011542]|uniref:hypothetical protein n=1 Tax=Micromonospora sp. GCM10011542 TaxID=3317337 RepID=UPI00361315A5